jgi:N-acetyl-anhydromuramyl-L-alanine amidase AmpD
VSYPYIQARNHGGTQGSVTRIVIHATVTPTKNFADNVAQDFHTTTREASAHYVVDQAHVYQCLSESTVGWHAPPNTGSIGVELCDPQTGSSARWHDADHEAMLRLAAKLVREVAARWHVPLVKLTAAQLKAGKRGICGHADVSAAWHLTDHTDPGTGFPWAHFMDLIKGEEDDMPFTEAQLRKMMREEAEKVMTADAVPAPGSNPADGFDPAHNAGFDPKKNPTWGRDSVRKQTIQGLVVVDQKLDALAKAVADLAAKVDQP